jgi:UDP-N-acetylglucosamine 2-epimerase (non-hydrolysing)
MNSQMEVDSPVSALHDLGTTIRSHMSTQPFRTRNRANRIVEVAGARPNFMKLASIHPLLRDAGLQPVFINTGQHYDWEMAAVILRDLGFPDPDYELRIGSGSHAEQTAGAMLTLEPILVELHPNLVVVVGDVNSTLAAALTAAKLGIHVAHVEAGLRSRDWSMPEEVNRILTDAMSQLMFAPSQDAVDNLRAEGRAAENIHLVGNVMIDALDRLLPRALESDVLQRLGLRARKYVLVTLHRPSNVDDAEALSRTVAVLIALASRMSIVFPVHPRTRRRLRDTGLESILANHDRVLVTEPMGYLDFLALQARGAAVLTDSGGIQEESTVLGVPCLTARTTTERPVTVTDGTNRLIPMDPERVVAALEGILDTADYEPRRPPLWDGHAAGRIVQVILDRLR